MHKWLINRLVGATSAGWGVGRQGAGMSEFDPPPSVPYRYRGSRGWRVEVVTGLVLAATLFGGGAAFGDWLAVRADAGAAPGEALDRCTADD